MRVLTCIPLHPQCGASCTGKPFPCPLLTAGCGALLDKVPSHLSFLKCSDQVFSAVLPFPIPSLPCPHQHQRRTQGHLILSWHFFHISLQSFPLICFSARRGRGVGSGGGGGSVKGNISVTGNPTSNQICLLDLHNSATAESCLDRLKLAGPHER